MYGFPGCFAGMAPKNPQKRKKGEASAPQPSRNQSFDMGRFKSRFHQERYVELLDQNMWAERVFNISPNGPYGEIAKLLKDQGWDRLCNPMTNLNAELVREFYANALPENPLTDIFPYETVVRGHTIKFDRAAINKYLGNPFELPRDHEYDEFHTKRNLGHFKVDETHEEIKRFLLFEGFNYDKSEVGREHRCQYKFMTNPAKIIQKFILYNVMPSSHMSDCVVEVCPLIYYILNGKPVDIARTIAWELRKVALQGKGEPAARLFFPGLIMGLIKDTGMKLPSAVHEKIRNPINDIFITRFIMGESKKDKGKGKQASSSQAPPPQEEPMPFQPTAAFDFASYVQWQHQSNMHTWNMLTAQNRANTYFQQSQYVMQQQVGYPQEVMDQFMTPQAFQNYVNWPEGMPGPYGGVGDFAGHENATMGEDVGGDEDDDRDDPANVPSATSSHDGSDDDMQS